MSDAEDKMVALIERRNKRAMILQVLRQSPEYQHYLELRGLDSANHEDLSPAPSPKNWEWCSKRAWEKNFWYYKDAIKKWSSRYLQLKSKDQKVQ